MRGGNGRIDKEQALGGGWWGKKSFSTGKKGASSLHFIEQKNKSKGVRLLQEIKSLQSQREIDSSTSEKSNHTHKKKKSTKKHSYKHKEKYKQKIKRKERIYQEGTRLPPSPRPTLTRRQ